MHLIRPIREADFDDLKKLASKAGAGFTTLPNDPKYLKNKINESLRAFDKKVTRPRGESYLFVLEDCKTAHVVGVSGIVSKVGGFEPFYTYKIKSERHVDSELKINKHVRFLHLSANHDGPSEICSLFLDPASRKAGLGRLLSLARFLFMAQFPKRFDKKVISELRGVIDEHGKSLFWEGVGRHFFETDFANADFLSGLGNKEFIKNLMPKHPIYIPILPKNVQQVIGKVNQHTAPALHLLQSEGFVYEDEVDIFDAGPTVSTALAEIRTVRQSRLAKIGEIVTEPIKGNDFLVANTLVDFRALTTSLKVLKSGQFVIEQEAAEALKIGVGDEVRFVGIR